MCLCPLYAGVGCLFVFKHIDMVADEEVHKMLNEMTMDVKDIVGESRTLVHPDISSP